MAASRRLTPDDREVVARSIKAGRFRDFDDFQARALKQAVARLLLVELRQLRDESGVKRLTPAEILREVRKVRHEVARSYGIA